MANTYYFINELLIDIDRAKELFKGTGVISKSNIKHSTWAYVEEFDTWCGHEVYKLETNLELCCVKAILDTGVDLHYIYNSINTIDNFDK